MKLIALILSVCLFSSAAFGDCDWTKIQKNADGTYTYSAELHLCVGKLVQDSKVKDQQISDLTQAITMKDLVIDKANQRADLWLNTSGSLEDRLQKVDNLQKKNELIYFGLGVLTASAAVYLAARAIGR